MGRFWQIHGQSVGSSAASVSSRLSIGVTIANFINFSFSILLYLVRFSIGYILVNVEAAKFV